MHPDEYLQELKRLKSVLGKHRGKQIFSEELHHQIRAVAETWPNDVRPQVKGSTGTNEEIETADKLARQIIGATYRNTTANKYLVLLDSLREAVINLRVKSTGTMPSGVRKASEETLAVERVL